MLKEKKEEPLVDGKKVRNIELCGNHVECNAGKVRLYIAKDAVTAKETIYLHPLHLKEVEFKAKGSTSNPELFEVYLTLSKRDLKGKMPRLMVPRDVRMQGGKGYVQTNINESDARLLGQKVEIDEKGFMKVDEIRKAFDLVSSGGVLVSGDSKDELEMLMEFGKALSRVGAVMNDAIKLPTDSVFIDRVAKMEELRKRRLG